MKLESLPAMPVNEGSSPHSRSDKLVAPALAIAICILIAMFVVLYVALDPLLSDLTSTGAESTITTTPAQETPISSPQP